MQDSLYRDIRTALGHRLDGDLFEEAMCDLLTDAYPNLAAVSGGSDDGMDGTIGEDGILVCTTAQDVIGNLTSSLNQHKKIGGSRTKVVVATSQPLTQKKKRNLENRARKLGFELLQVFDRDALVPRLHRNPLWCKELLGLTGTPSTLSTTPKMRRPLLDIELVAREEALAWLLEQSGDRVLVGAPGSGKTAILAQLASDGWGLFVTSEDQGELANDIRAQSPDVVIADDAHINPQFLLTLRQLRDQGYADFAIVAATWESAALEVSECLGAVPDERVYELPQLTRDELVEVIERAGIVQPVDLVRAIVDQSANQPGLAVTLTRAVLQGDIDGLRTGRAVADYVTAWLDRVEVQKPVLGAIAVGGKTGMDITALAAELNMAKPDLLTMVSHAAAAGIVVADRNQQDRVALRPQALRARLVAEVFFPDDGPALPYSDVAALALDSDDALRVLVQAALIGAQVPHDLLRHRVVASRDSYVWALYIQLGELQAEWAIDHCPALTRPVIEALLHVLPERAVKILSEQAVGDSRRLGQTPDHPRRVIDEWVCSLRTPPTEMRKRREAVVSVAEELERSVQESGIAAQIACLALSPKIESSHMDPGVGKTLTIQWGIAPPEVLESIKTLWPRVRSLIAEVPNRTWSSATDILHSWTFPETTARGTGVPSDLYDQMREFARQVLEDLAEIAGESSGLLRQLGTFARELNVSLPEPDSDFAILFPADTFGEDWRKQEARQLDAVEKLAQELSEEPILRVLERVAAVEREAATAGIDHPRLTPRLCERLAEDLSAPIASIVDGILDANLRADLVVPFLERLREEDSSHWEAVVERMFGDADYRYAACSIGVRADNPPKHILDLTLEAISEFPQIAELASLRNEVSQQTLALLLKHQSAAVALETAEGVSNSNEGLASLPEPLMADWRQAILRTANVATTSWPSTTSYRLAEILASESQLSLEWITHRLESKHHDILLDNKDVVSKALSCLNIQDREALLSNPNLVNTTGEVVASIVGSNADLYKKLLERPDLEDKYLAPLEGEPSGDAWKQMARMALDAGCSARQIVGASYPSSGFWSGSEAEHWRPWKESFSELEEDDDPQLQALGREGAEHYGDLVQRAEARERDEELRGLGGES